MVILMYEIDGINIGDVNYGRVCLNCRYWQGNGQIKGAAKGMIWANDSCSMFSPNQSADSMQNPNSYFDKRNKMDVWKL